MIPRLAALSIAEMTPGIPSKLGTSEERTCFCIVRRRVPTLRLRSDRFNVWRARLVADLVLAIVDQKFRGPGPRVVPEAEGLQALANSDPRLRSLRTSRPPLRHCLAHN